MADRIVIINKLGLHARASAKLVREASRYDCSIQIKKGNQCADAKDILDVMTLAASQGTELEFIFDGADTEQAKASLFALINRRFDEAE